MNHAEMKVVGKLPRTSVERGAQNVQLCMFDGKALRSSRTPRAALASKFLSINSRMNINCSQYVRETLKCRCRNQSSCQSWIQSIVNDNKTFEHDLAKTFHDSVPKNVASRPSLVLPSKANFKSNEPSLLIGWRIKHSIFCSEDVTRAKVTNFVIRFKVLLVLIAGLAVFFSFRDHKCAVPSHGEFLIIFPNSIDKRLVYGAISQTTHLT